MNNTISQTLNETANQTIVTILGHSPPFILNPILDIYIITLFTSLFITIINKYMTDQEKIKKLRLEMKDLQKKMREQMAKDPQKAQGLQQEIMKKSMENMKHAMNPKVMLITLIPILLVFTFVSKVYSPLGSFFDLGLNILWLPWGWLGTYILFSLINAILLKKLLNVA